MLKFKNVKRLNFGLSQTLGLLKKVNLKPTFARPATGPSPTNPTDLKLYFLHEQ